jgi:hypothetical protein
MATRIRFEADNSAHWDAFQWDSASKKKAAKKQLRIEVIDLLGIAYTEYSLSLTTIVNVGRMSLSTPIEDILFSPKG